MAVVVAGSTAPAYASRIAEEKIGIMGPDCTYPFCGRVVNRTPYSILISQNYTDGQGCVGPNDWLAPGENSYQNPYKDTDCVAVYECNFLVNDTNKIRAGYWARISNLPFAQEVKCA